MAIVFERVNRLGIALDAFQLLTAWSWSEDFDLQEQFRELATELEPFGFASVSEDPNLSLRCCAAVIVGDASPNALVSLNGAVVRDRFDEIRNGVLGAVDFLRKNLGVETLENLPYSTVLVPLSVFFALPDGHEVSVSADQRRQILRWFWRTWFSRRYSSGVLRNLKSDIDEMRRLQSNQDSSLGAFTATVDPEFFTDNTFIASVVNTKTFVLLLAQQKPLSFASGAPIDLGRVLREYNRNEFHHLYPRTFLGDSHEIPDINRLTNFAFISRVDNKRLGGQAPSKYRARMDSDNEAEILSRALTPTSLFDDEYEKFTRERAACLANAARLLIT